MPERRKELKILLFVLRPGKTLCVIGERIHARRAGIGLQKSFRPALREKLCVNAQLHNDMLTESCRTRTITLRMTRLRLIAETGLLRHVS